MSPADLFPKALFERRRRALQSFAAWEADRPPVSPPGEAMALLGFLWEMLPPEVRRAELPGDYSGVKAMRTALSVLRSPR